MNVYSYSAKFAVYKELAEGSVSEGCADVIKCVLSTALQSSTHLQSAMWIQQTRLAHLRTFCHLSSIVHDHFDWLRISDFSFICEKGDFNCHLLHKLIISK